MISQELEVTIHLALFFFPPPPPRGRSDKAKQQLFTPFTRLGDTTNSRGLGLGAAVAKGLAEGIGGELVADDTPGGGLTMVLTLPIGKATHTPFVSDHMKTRSTP